MHYAEMHAAHFVRVVIEQRDDAVRIFRAQLQLFGNFALHRRVVRRAIENEEVMVFSIHMSADADRSFRDEPLLARLFPAHVMQHAPVVDEDDIRNDLLQIRIRLRRRARSEEVILARQKRGQVFFHIKAEPLKRAELIEERAADDEDLFFFHPAVLARKPPRAQPIILPNSAAAFRGDRCGLGRGRFLRRGR